MAEHDDDAQGCCRAGAARYLVSCVCPPELAAILARCRLRPPYPHTLRLRQLLAGSWELEQSLKATPRASTAALARLSKAPDVCDFARDKAAQLAKQRAAWEGSERRKHQQRATATAALQDWHARQLQVMRAGNCRQCRLEALALLTSVLCSCRTSGGPVSAAAAAAVQTRAPCCGTRGPASQV